MGNETSQDQPSDSDHPSLPHPTMPPRSSTPLSESCEVASMCSRRLSSASLGQFDDPPEVDLSHLSAEERAKIAAVMERARQAQDEEADRIRELEEDFQASCIARGDYEQDYDTTDLCPVCDTTELTGENVNVCSNCETFVCPNCGAYDSNLTTKLQEWVCLLCQKQRQTQQELRDTGPPQQQETEDHTTGQVEVEKSGANILDVGQPDLHKQDIPYSRRNDQHKADTGYAEQPGVEPPHTRSGGQAKVHQTYTRDIVEPNPQSTDNDYAKQQDLHTSDTRYEVSDTPYEVSDIRYEGEIEKHGRDAYLEAQREQIKSDTHYESNERTYSRDSYSGNSGHPDEPMTDVRYTRHTEGNGDAATSLHAICRTTSLQDGLVDAADSTSACAAIRRSFDAPCVTDYHELSDSSDDVAGSDYERMHRSVTDYEAQGDTFRSGGQSSGRRVLTEADLDTANSELSYVDAYSHNWIHRDDDTVNTDVGDAEFADDSIDIGRGKTARPRQLVLGQQSTERPHSASQRRDGSGGVTQKQDGSAEKTGGEPIGNLVEKTTEVHQQKASVASRIADVRDGQRWSSTQPLGQPAKTTPRHELVDGQSSPAEVTERHDGLRKKKPSALEKVSVNEAESDKRVSPSRRSPRSPPRSPSWMRYRDGSSRSSPNRTLSPPISPTARYQSSLPDSTHGSCDDSYDGDYFTYAGNYMHDQQGKIQSLADDALSYNDRVQPKPARSFSDQRSLSDDAIEMESLDLATFAAAVASDTAHLTNLSVSPTQQDVIDTARDDVLSMTAIGSGDVDVLPEPKPKSIDHHGSKRQKTKPPPTDWSPVTDLSPIIDVSPSIEAIEQAEMWAQQDPRTRAKDMTLSAQDATDSDSRYLTQSLKRYQHFDDISKIGNGVLQSNDEADVAGDSGGGHAAIGDIRSARDISNERRIGRVLVESQMQPPVVFVPPVTLIQTSCHTSQTTPVTLTQPSYQTPQTTPVTLTQSIRRIPDATPVMITEIAHKTPDTTPVTLTQTTPHRITDTTPVTLTQSTPHRIPDTIPVTMTQTTQHRIPDTIPITLTQTARRTPETTPVAMTQPKPHRIPDTTTVTLTQTVRRTPDTTTVTIAQSTPHPIPDTTPVTITHTTPHRIPDTTSVTTTQSTPDMTPVTTTQSTLHRIADTTPVTVAQTTHRTPNDVTHTVRQIPDIPQTVPHNVPLRQEDRRADENKVHLAEGLNKDSRPVNESDKSAMSNPPLQPPPDDQAHAANRRAEERKIRRKLPQLPPDGATTTTPERPGPQTSEKELLRQRLRQRQAENRRPQKQPHTNVEEISKPDVMSRIRATSTVDKPQARKQSAPIATPSVTTRTPGTSKQGSTQLPPVHHPAPTPLVTPTAAGVGRVYENGERPTANVALSSGNATRPSSIVDRPSTSVIRPRARMQPCQEESTTVHGIRVPVDVKFLKQRLKEEIQIVTASRRLRIDEQDELRRMEVMLALREKQRLDAEADAAAKQHSNGSRTDRTTLATQTKQRSGGLVNQNGSTPNQQRAVSPHALTTRRIKHKRQISDPVVTKFSPIEEDRDVEHDMNAKMRADDVRRPEVRHVDASTRTAQACNTSGVFIAPVSKQPIPNSKLATSLSRSSEVLHDYSIVEREARLMNSQSESCLPITTPPRCRTPTFEERRKKERRKNELQQEIDRRKRQLEEAMLMAEANNVEPEVHDICFQHVRAADTAAAGIIKPIDYGRAEALDYYGDLIYSETNDEELSYSSTEYLAHKCERYPRTSHEHPYIPVEFLSDSEYDIQCRSRNGNQNLLTTVGSAPSLGYPVTVQQAGMSGRLAANMSRPCDTDRFPVCGATDQLADCEFAANLTDVSTTPGSEAGPSAMPLLADVQHRSRTLVRNIGSRPLSDDLEKYYFAKDPLNTMYRADSDRSLGDSDENVMEGGVTIKEHVDQRPPASAARNRSKYDFPTKRILLTRDPKDRVVKGNTMGMRIVGGKLIPGGGGEVGAYVAAIYPGGVAEQLHGELREGDQVLEWNGLTLTGKTFEEVQQTIAQPNGELELVVRPGAELTNRKQHSNTMSTLCSDSCHSSYDNLDSVSDDNDNDYEHLPDAGVDLDHTKLSPGASVTSSQPDLDLTPSLSTSASSEQTDPASTDSPSDAATKPHVTSRDPSVTRQQKQADTFPDSRQDTTNMGDIQLQLSHDDYDGTLNVHVIQARSLQPKDKNGFSDPYVKVYLLPGRSPEKKRRTKYIARSLDPEWHQTLVFMNIPRTQLVAKTLEVTVWDYDRFKPNDFLGEVLIELSERHSLDNKPHWYPLRSHSDAADFASRSPPPGGATSSPKSPSRKRDPKEKSPKGRRQAKLESSPATEPGSTKFSLGLGRRKGQGSSDAEMHIGKTNTS